MKFKGYNICIIAILILIITEYTLGIKNSNVISNSDSLSEPKNKDLKVDETRDHEPPPEFYRGGTLNNMMSNDRESVRDKDRYGFLRPLRYGGYGDFQTSPGAYDARYPSIESSTGTGYGLSNNKNTNINNNNRNKFGYNQYGTTATLSSPGIGLGLGSNGLTGNSNTYYDYSSIKNRPPYGNSVGLGDFGHNYEQDHYYAYDKNNGIDFGQNDYGNFGLPALGSGSGKEITKSVLLPLAGAALLGIAAALVANPVLLNLGVMSGRKKRNIIDIKKKDNINKKSQRLAYKGYTNY